MTKTSIPEDSTEATGGLDRRAMLKVGMGGIMAALAASGPAVAAASASA